MLKIISASDPRALGRLLAVDPADDAALVKRVAAIVADVRRGGDRALVAYARRFDKLPASGPAGAVEIPRAEIEAGARSASAGRSARRSSAPPASSAASRGRRCRRARGPRRGRAWSSSSA